MNGAENRSIVAAFVEGRGVSERKGVSRLLVLLLLLLVSCCWSTKFLAQHTELDEYIRKGHGDILSRAAAALELQPVMSRVS
jgi:hypothetical protein